MKQGWKIVTLGDVCKTTQGIQISKSNQENKLLHNYKRYLYISDFKNEKNLKYVENIYPEKIVTEKDLIVVNTGASAGDIFRGIDGILSNNLFKVSFDDKIIDPDFIFYFVNSDIFKNHQSFIMRGTANPHMGHENFKSTPFKYPNINEQKSIVAILDEVFAFIAKAKANAEQNLNNAKELFESYLQSVFENKGEDWEEKTIQEITKVVNGYAFSSKDFRSTNTIKSIKITNVGVKEFVEETDNFLPEKYKTTLKEYQVKEGNIVIALTRTIIAAGLKVAVVPKSYDGALINQRVAALVPNEKLVNQRYLYNYLTTAGVTKYVLSNVNTLMQPNLSINDLKNMLVPCPPLEEQQAIVRNLNALSAETNKLETIYQQKINDLEELKKSVLQKAFRGELKTEKSVFASN